MEEAGAVFDKAKEHFFVALDHISKERWADAEKELKVSLEYIPDRISTITNLCATLIKQKKFYDAKALITKAEALRPNNSEIILNQGLIFYEEKLYQKALVSFDRSIELRPQYAEAWLNRGNALNDLNRHEEALASYERAIELKPDYAEAWSNRGNALNDLKRHEEALATYERAIELKPDYAEAFWNKSLSQLRLGNFQEGWQLYEWRWKLDDFTSPKRNFTNPLWLGSETLSGKTILLHAEQGFGDTIQFCRYARLVRDLGAKVIIEVQDSLFEVIKNLQGVDLVLRSGDPLSAFDYHCPLMSLPLAFKTEIDSIPAETPYLYVDSSKKTQWSQYTNLENAKPAIGIAWAGNPIHKNDHNRSIRFELMQKILSDEFNWLCLQKNIASTEREMLEAVKVRDYSTELGNFADTAALISQLDLIISVDTSVAHLAGALGKPTWVLLPHVPDFRWMWDRDDSPWYPTMRLFRQTVPGDWDSVLSKVSDELQKFSKF